MRCGGQDSRHRGDLAGVPAHRVAAERDRLILQYAPLVKYVAARTKSGLPRHLDLGDLISCGMFGLIDAIERFDPERGVKFETYAAPRIKGAIMDELRDCLGPEIRAREGERRRGRFGQAVPEARSRTKRLGSGGRDGHSRTRGGAGPDAAPPRGSSFRSIVESPARRKRQR